jgi:hypothetical protein
MLGMLSGELARRHRLAGLAPLDKLLEKLGQDTV